MSLSIHGEVLPVKSIRIATESHSTTQETTPPSQEVKLPHYSPQTHNYQKHWTATRHDFGSRDMLLPPENSSVDDVDPLVHVPKNFMVSRQRLRCGVLCDRESGRLYLRFLRWPLRRRLRHRDIIGVNVAEHLISARKSDWGGFPCRSHACSIQFNSIRWIRVESIRLNSIQFSPIRFNSIRLDPIRFDWIQFNSIHCNSIRLKSIQFRWIQACSDQFNSMQCSAIQFMIAKPPWTPTRPS